MRIRKVSNTRPLSATVVSEYNNNQINAYSTNYINNINNHSTSETFTGKHWVNGKPIYRKVLNNISIIEGTAHTIETGITNIENLTKLEGILKNTGNSQYVVIPAYYSPTIFISANYKYDENRIYYDSATFSGTAIIILEYTKTTD